MSTVFVAATKILRNTVSCGPFSRGSGRDGAETAKELSFGFRLFLSFPGYWIQAVAEAAAGPRSSGGMFRNLAAA